MAHSQECLSSASLLLDIAASNFQHFTPTDLGSLARSAMQLGVGSNVFYDALAVTSIHRLSDFDMRDLTTMLQACSQAEGLALATVVLEKELTARRQRECIAASSLAANANKGEMLLKELQKSTGQGQQPLQSSSSYTASTAASGFPPLELGGEHERVSNQSGNAGSFRPAPNATAYANAKDAPMYGSQWKVPEPSLAELRPPPGLESCTPIQRPSLSKKNQPGGILSMPTLGFLL